MAHTNVKSVRLSLTLKETLKNITIQDAVNVIISSKSAYTKYIKDIIALDRQEKNHNASVRIRLSPRQEEELLSIFHTHNLSLAIRCTIRLAPTMQNHIKVLKSDTSVRIIGQKFGFMRDYINDVLRDTASTYHHLESYIEPFMGSANLYLHNSLNLATTLNDIDTFRVNTLRVIKDYPYDLQRELRKLALNEQTLKQFCKDLKKSDTPALRSKASKIAYACKYYYVYNLSYYFKGDSLNKKIDIKKYHKRVNSIVRLSRKLQNVKIKNTDGLYLLDTLANSHNSLIYMDPPYIYTEHWYKLKRIFKKHMALKNRILKLKANNNICFISYRCTTPAICKYTDQHLISKLDAMYQDNGLHITFKSMRKGQVEILIGTVPFIQSVPYDRSISTLLKSNL